MKGARYRKSDLGIHLSAEVQPRQRALGGRFITATSGSLGWSSLSAIQADCEYANEDKRSLGSREEESLTT